MRRRLRTKVTAVGGVMALAASALVVSITTGLPASATAAPAVEAAAVTPLVGTFQLSGGSCSGGVSGTYFRMIQPGGTVNGPDSGYLTNADSTCAANKTYTPLQPGSDGGLITGGYQPEPNPAFDGTGNSLAGRIVAPAKFFGINFSVSTAATDPQTASAVAAPSISADGIILTGDLRAFSASWNTGHFNQGAPKPNGTNPGLTSGPTGAYNPTSKAFILSWTSQIVGGPFNNFTGQWHLVGTFVPASSGPTPKVAIGNASIVEGASGSRAVRFTVSLSAKSTAPVNVAYATKPGTAAAGSDFTARSGTVSIPAGSTSAVVSISVKGDTTVEPKEAFTVKLSAPTGATLGRTTGTGSILNDDPSAGLRVSVGDAAVSEGTSSSRAARFTVSLSAKSASPVTVAYTTQAGTAAAGTDFVAKSGTATIPAGSTSALVSVSIRGDAASEPNETFTVTLAAPSGATRYRAKGTGTILNDD